MEKKKLYYRLVLGWAGGKKINETIEDCSIFETGRKRGEIIYCQKNSFPQEIAYFCPLNISPFNKRYLIYFIINTDNQYG